MPARVKKRELVERIARLNFDVRTDLSVQPVGPRILGCGGMFTFRGAWNGASENGCRRSRGRHFGVWKKMVEASGGARSMKEVDLLSERFHSSGV